MNTFCQITAESVGWIIKMPKEPKNVTSWPTKMSPLLNKGQPSGRRKWVLPRFA